MLQSPTQTQTPTRLRKLFFFFPKLYDFLKIKAKGKATLTQFTGVAVWLRLTANLGATKQAFTQDPHSAGATDQGVAWDPGEKKTHVETSSETLGVVASDLLLSVWVVLAQAWLHVL